LPRAPLLSSPSIARRGVSTMDPSCLPPEAGGASHPKGEIPKPPTCDRKTRLTREQRDVLEQYFQAQHKPSTDFKKKIASNLGLPLGQINVSNDPSLFPHANMTAELVSKSQVQVQEGQRGGCEPAEHAVTV
jgi:hypothetical protein